MKTKTYKTGERGTGFYVTYTIKKMWSDEGWGVPMYVIVECKAEMMAVAMDNSSLVGVKNVRLNRTGRFRADAHFVTAEQERNGNIFLNKKELWKFTVLS